MLLKTKLAINHWSNVSKKVFTAFINGTDSDSNIQTTGRVGGAIVKRGFFLQIDYWLTALEFSLAASLHAWQPFEGWAQILFVFSALWLFELACAIPFIVTWKKTGIDITLAADARRAINELKIHSKLLGQCMFVALIVKGVTWDGPEELIIFCNKEISSTKAILITLILVSAVQAALWGYVYIWGFEAMVWVWQYLSSTWL